MSALFDSYRAQALQADCDLDDSIKVILVDEGTDTPVPATDDFLEDILGGARVATSPALAGKTFVAGVFDANDVTLPSVSGATVESLVLFNDTPATEATKDLIAYINSGTGLPATPGGGDIIIQWDAGANRIFKI